MDTTLLDYRHRLLDETFHLMQRIDETERANYANIARNAIGINSGARTKSLRGSEATAAVDLALIDIKAEAQKLADRWPNSGWFPALRYLPTFAWGHAENVMTRVERMGVADALSALSRAEEIGDDWRPPPTPLLTRFAYCARAYAAAQVARRVSARNIAVRFPARTFIDFDRTYPLYNCLQVQDQRRTLDGGDFIARFGTQITQPAGTSPISWKWFFELCHGCRMTTQKSSLSYSMVP